VNQFIDILNRIRQAADLAWLTPSQQKAREAILERLKFLDEVNLWGYPGTGKTFLGWMLQKEGIADYVSEPKAIQLAFKTRTIVVDNAGWKRNEVRDILHRARQFGYNQSILITTEPVQEQMATVELVLTPEDKEWVALNLRRIRVIPYRDAPETLWDVVSPIDLRL
jgi:hypothetical protein